MHKLFKVHFSLQVFQGNRNTYIAEMRPVDPPIIARRVRFVPYSEHSRAVCMRVELHGCDWEGRRRVVASGLVFYLSKRGIGPEKLLTTVLKKVKVCVL